MKRNIANTVCSSVYDGEVLIFVEVLIRGIKGKALVDSGCQKSVVSTWYCRRLGLTPRGPRRNICMLNGETTSCAGEVWLKPEVEGQAVELCCIVADELVCGAQMILGLDCITRLGGMCIDKSRRVCFGVKSEPITSVGIQQEVTNKLLVSIEDSDFMAKFDGERWVVEWKWKNGEPTLVNTCGEYAMSDDTRELFESEVDKWIEDGWLERYDQQRHGKVDGIVPLMAAKQPNKEKKVRPVLDYREVNGHVISHPGYDTAVCQDKLRKWRIDGENVSLLDLKKAYLQVHVVDALKRFQVVQYKRQLYVMTRMGFGLSVAPKIMSKIISRVLSLDKTIEEGTDHYIDDIWVNENVVKAKDVKKHLVEYGLITKEPISIRDARVLGLRVYERDNRKVWKRDSEFPSFSEIITKREIFSVFGKLIGHYPIGRWLRVACSYVKRLTNGLKWDEVVPAKVGSLARELMQKMCHDPVYGKWVVNGGDECVVWCDSSSLAMGVVMEIDGERVEDAAWLRKEDDGSHINVAELEAVLKGVNLAVKWGRRKVKIMTDSACVYSWVRSMLEDTGRPRVSGLSEMIIRRRLSTIRQINQEYELSLTIELIPSHKNIADEMTRVPKKWLEKEIVCVGVSGEAKIFDRVREIHNQHHLGVDRTWYLAKKQLEVEINENIVKQVIARCSKCRSIDPGPEKWEHGKLEVTSVWTRLASDITHVSGVPYLSVVDCGPSRFAIWRSLRNETTRAVREELQNIFQERGPPVEFLTDNGPCFASREMSAFLESWCVSHVFSAAYRPSGNGIAERNHRTIKRMVARSGRGVGEMLYWYNNSPNSNGIVPSELVYDYKTEIPSKEREVEKGEAKVHRKYSVGDAVYVKPPGARCDTEWKLGKVTGIVSDRVVEIDGTNRHVSDIRLVEMGASSADIEDGALEGRVSESGVSIIGEEDAQENEGSDVDEAENGSDSVRERRPPRWMSDYYLF